MVCILFCVVNNYSVVYKILTKFCYLLTRPQIIVNRNRFMIHVRNCLIFNNHKLADEFVLGGIENVCSYQDNYIHFQSEINESEEISEIND